MLIDNKITKLLSGPYIFMGFVFLVPGLYILYSQLWLLASVPLLIAWFFFATYSGVEIDTDKREVREYNKWFGLFKTGKWKPLDNYLGVTLVSMNKVYRIYSRSNRINSSSEIEFRIYLVSKTKKPAIDIKKCKSQEQGQSSLDEFSIWLKLPIFSVK